MKTSLKTGFAQISLAAKKSELPKIWGGGAAASLPPPPAPYDIVPKKCCEKLQPFVAQA